MKPSHAWTRAALAAGCALLTCSAHAALQARDADGDGSADGYYDTVLDITWWADTLAPTGTAFDDGASTSDGLLTWSGANAWLAAFSPFGTTGWRLPHIDTACGGVFWAPSPNCSSPASELGTMFYLNLGGSAGSAIAAHHNGSLTLFSGIGNRTFWSGDTFTWDPEQAGTFAFEDGFQDLELKEYVELAVWAVADGDVLPAVPEPATLLLSCLGLGALRLRLRQPR